MSCGLPAQSILQAFIVQGPMGSRLAGFIERLWDLIPDTI